MDTTIPTMLGIKEVQRRTGVSYECIRQLCLQRKIIYIKSGSKYLINFESFCEYLRHGD